MATPVGLKQAVEKEFDPERETEEAWHNRIKRGIQQLQALGEPLTEEEVEKIIIKGGHAKKLDGLTLEQQVAVLKRDFGEVLLAEKDYEPKEYNARLQGIIEMLRARGTQMSTSVNKLFSTGEPSRTSLEASPERLQRRDSPRASGGERGDEWRRASEDAYSTPTKERRREERESPDEGLAAAIRQQTLALQKALMKPDVKHSVMKVTPSVRWPILADEGPDSKEVEEF